MKKRKGPAYRILVRKRRPGTPHSSGQSDFSAPIPSRTASAKCDRPARRPPAPANGAGRRRIETLCAVASSRPIRTTPASGEGAPFPPRPDRTGHRCRWRNTHHRLGETRVCHEFRGQPTRPSRKASRACGCFGWPALVRPETWRDFRHQTKNGISACYQASTAAWERVRRSLHDSAPATNLTGQQLRLPCPLSRAEAQAAPLHSPV